MSRSLDAKITRIISLLLYLCIVYIYIVKLKFVFWTAMTCFTYCPQLILFVCINGIIESILKSVSTKCRLQTADCRLQTGYKMQTRYKMQTADCRLGIKCRLRPKLDINCRLSERNVFNVPQCHAIAFPSLSAAKSFLLGAKRQHWIGRLYYFLNQRNITCLFASANRKISFLTCRDWTRCKLISDTANHVTRSLTLFARGGPGQHGGVCAFGKLWVVVLERFLRDIVHVKVILLLKSFEETVCLVQGADI